MDRDILFRGFHEDIMGSKTIIVDGKEVSGEWIYGYYVKFRMNKENPVAHYIQQLQEDKRLDIIQEVIPSTVGQYTGVDEIDGMGIYEGDRCKLIKDESCIRGDIKFQNGSFYFKENCGETQMELNCFEVLEKYIGYRVMCNGTIFDKKRTKQTNWIKLPPIKGGTCGCLHCGCQHDIAPMDMLIAVGFGDATVTKNGITIYSEDETELASKDLWTTETAERQARKEPNNDWRINLQAPLSGRTYQRQGENIWVLVEKSIGFA